MQSGPHDSTASSSTHNQLGSAVPAIRAACAKPSTPPARTSSTSPCSVAPNLGVLIIPWNAAFGAQEVQTVPVVRALPSRRRESNSPAMQALPRSEEHTSELQSRQCL